MTAPRRAIRVMCVDDNQLLAEALEQQVAADPRFTWCGWVSQAEDVLPQVIKDGPDVVLLDIDMPGPDVFEVLPSVVSAAPGCKVLIFSAYVRRDYVDRAVQAGAWGYVSKNAEIAEVLNAIERAAAGEFVMTDDIVREQLTLPTE
jgi:two-component system response regulator DesR